MNSNSKEFIDYLQYIGFLSKNSINNFLNILNNEIDNINLNNNNNYNKNFNNNNSNILLNSIINFVSNLNENDIKNLANGLIERFNENKKKITEKYLLKLLEIYEKNFLYKNFNKWKKITKFNNENENYQISYNSTNSFNFINNTHKKIYSNNLNNNQNNNNNRKIFKKNYSYKNLKNFNNFNNNNNNNNNLNITSNQILNQDFFSRLKNYSKKTQDNFEKNIIRSENELKLVCSFSPKVNSNTKKVKSKYNKINNNNINKNNQSNKNIKNSNSKLTTISNKEAIDRLYNDYKNSQIRKKNLQKEIDEERGLTFKPKIFSDKSSIVIEDNFEERNKKLIEDRKNFVFIYDYLRQKEINENSIGGGKTNDLLQTYVNKNNLMKENPNYEILLGQNYYNY